MRISRLEIRRTDLALSRPYTIAYKTIDQVENIIVRLELENGQMGWGAANPSKQVVGESVTDTLEQLQGAEEYLLGKPIREFGELLGLVHRHYGGHPGAEAALDIALHDAFSCFLGVPLARLLGQAQESLPTSITIGIKDAAATVAEASEYLARGFRILKVKLGHSWEEDVERLVLLREAIGFEVGIRVDANQGYSAHELIRFFEKIRSLKIELIEQPLSCKAVTEMKQLPANIKNQIAADESLIGPADAFKLAEYPAACGIFNIKLMKCGGISPALKIAHIAESAHIDLMWGCNDESAISISAALHAALSCPHTHYLDLDGSLDLARDVVEGGFILENGRMRCNGLPGLGVWEPEC